MLSGSGISAILASPKTLCNLKSAAGAMATPIPCVRFPTNHSGQLKQSDMIFIVDPATDELFWIYQNDEIGGQYDAELLDNGNILVFANGAYSPDLHYSQVREINTVTYEIEWRYSAGQYDLVLLTANGWCAAAARRQYPDLQRQQGLYLRLVTPLGPGAVSKKWGRRSPYPCCRCSMAIRSG